MKDRRAALLDRAQRRDARLANHRRRHIARRMQAIDRHAGPFERIGEIEGEHDLRQLALHIGAAAGIAAAQHDIVKIDRLLTGGGDIDDARRRAGREQRQQQRRQRKAREIIDGEAQFAARRIHPPLRARAARADPRIVDEQVEPPGAVANGAREAAHFVERRKIGGKETGLAAAAFDFGHDLPPRAASRPWTKTSAPAAPSLRATSGRRRRSSR